MPKKYPKFVPNISNLMDFNIDWRRWWADRTHNPMIVKIGPNRISYITKVKKK
tara:strand:+ start:251 stop:409 length:159 start_codon:yes stop_codon:yes gene_type:complete